MYHLGEDNEAAGKVLAVLVLGMSWYLEEGETLAEGEGETWLEARGVVDRLPARESWLV